MTRPPDYKKKDARYLIRLKNTDAYTPADCRRLLNKVREKVHSPGASAMNLRVSRFAVEFDLFCEPETKLGALLCALSSIGSVLTVKRLDGPSPPIDPQEMVSEARALFNAERYWEVHEVLEGLWKKSRGPEKELLQGLILAAAALVHAQKNEWNVVWPMLKEASRRLRNPPMTYYGLSVRKFLKILETSMGTKNVDFPTI